jgi:hypothetical protein
MKAEITDGHQTFPGEILIELIINVNQRIKRGRHGKPSSWIY